MYDGNAFFLPGNLFINQSRNNLMIIYHGLSGGADVKGSSISSSLLARPRSNYMLRVSPAHHGWAAKERLTPVFFCVDVPGLP